MINLTKKIFFIGDRNIMYTETTIIEIIIVIVIVTTQNNKITNKIKVVSIRSICQTLKGLLHLLGPI